MLDRRMMHKARRGQVAIRYARLALVGAVIGATSVAAQSTVLEKRVTVAPGVALRVIESRALGRAIVFIPGGSPGADIGRGQISRFQQGHRITAFAPRSQGKSTYTADGNTPEQRAVDL